MEVALATLSVWVPGRGDMLLGPLSVLERAGNIVAIAVAIVFGWLAVAGFTRNDKPPTT